MSEWVSVMHKGCERRVVCAVPTPDLLRGQLEPVHTQVLLDVLGDMVGVAELWLCVVVCVCM